jgi:Beta-lactamase
MAMDLDGRNATDFRLSMRAALIAIAAALVAGLSGTCAAMSDAELERVITREIAPMADEIGGAAVAVHRDGRTTFFNYGLAERANKRPITLDSLFNVASIRKVFEATLLAQAVNLGELALADRAADYVTECVTEASSLSISRAVSTMHPRISGWFRGKGLESLSWSIAANSIPMTLLVSASCRRSRANRALEEGDILDSDVATPARPVPPDWTPDEAARRKNPRR